MSEHVWTQENLAAHVAGGLDATERERLQRHVAECFDCTSALESARAADRKLLAVFASVQPGPALEDRLIQSLRQRTARKHSRRMTGWFKAVLATAAVALFAVLGAGISMLIEQDRLGFSEFQEGASAEPSYTYYLRGALVKKDLEGIALNGLVDYSGSMYSPDGKKLLRAEEMNGEAVWSEQLAQELRQKSLFALVDGRELGEGKKHMIGLGTGTMAGNVSPHGNLKFWDEATKRSAEGDFDTARKFDVSVPGSTKPSDTYRLKVEVKDKDKDVTALPITSPAPPVLPPPVSEAGPGKLVGGAGSSPSKPSSQEWGAYKGTQSGQSSGRGKESKQPLTGYYFKPEDWFAKGDEKAKDEGEKAQKDLEKMHEKFAPPGEKQTPSTTETKEGQQKELKNAKEKLLDDFDKLLHAKTPEYNLTGQKEPKPEPAPVVQKIIIRSGDIDFEVDSFDAAVETIQKLIAALRNDGGFVATINSDKLPNGKVRGSVVVRVPPVHLDKLVLDLRKELGKTGELKGQRIGSQDITKQFTDLQSRLKAARTMEERLLSIIKNGKGEIKDLLLAEKELGVWRTRIEEVTGELNYYSNLVSLSTLTITLAEKELRVAAAVTESERVQAGVEVEDVDKAMREVLKAVDEFKGRVTRSEMKQQSAAGQFSANLNFEVAPESAGPMRDRLKQLGTLARLEIDRVQEAEGGDKLPQDGKLHRGKTKFFVNLYNLFAMTPRETVTVRVFVADVAAAYRELREAITTAKGRILDANVSEQDRQNVIAHLDFDVRRTDEAAIYAALLAAGEQLGRQVARTPAGANFTDTKVLFRVDLVANVPARETVTIRLAALDVAAAYAALREVVGTSKGRVVNAHLNEQDRQSTGAQLDFDVRRADEGAVQVALLAAGEVLTRHVARLPEGDNVTDTKIQFKVEFAANVAPRETVTLKVAAPDVATAYRALREAVTKAKGRIINADLKELDRKNVDGDLDFDIRRTEEGLVQAALNETGAVLFRHVARASGENLTDSRMLFKVKLVPAGNIEPREIHVLAVEVGDVEKEVSILTAQVKELQGRVVTGPLTAQERSGQVTAHVVYDVPLVMAGSILDKIRGAGQVRVSKVTPNPQAPEGKLALARINVTMANADVLVPRDEGLWAQVRSGLSVSLRGLFVSVNFLIVALLFVLPWLLLLAAGFWLVRRVWRPAMLATETAGGDAGTVATPTGAQ